MQTRHKIKKRDKRNSTRQSGKGVQRRGRNREKVREGRGHMMHDERETRSKGVRRTRVARGRKRSKTERKRGLIRRKSSVESTFKMEQEERKGDRY